MAQLTTQDLWAMYIQGIISAQGIPPTSANNFILLGTTTVANLYTGGVGLGTNPTLAQALAQIYTIGDQMLSPTGVYTTTANSFFSDYATYIDNLVPQGAQPSPSVLAALAQDHAAVNKANAQYEADLTAASSAFTTQGALFPGKWKDLQSFLNTTTWGATLGTDQAAVDGANATLNTDMTTAYGQNYAAIAQAKAVVDQVRRDLVQTSPTTPADMLITSEVGNFVVPTYVPSDLATFSDWANSNAVGPAHGVSPSVNISLQQGAAEYDFSQSAYFANTNWNDDFVFFSVGGSASVGRQAVSIDTASSQFKVTITMQGITTVGIDFGPWYDSSLMSSFGNPKGLAVPSGVRALVICMMPTITATFDSASYAAAKSAFQASGSFNVGPFSGSASSSSSSSSAVFNDSSLSVTITQNQVQPVILGVTVTAPGTVAATASPRHRLPISPRLVRA